MEATAPSASPMPSGAQPRPLKVLVLSDGRPGHFNQSKGVLRALELGRQLDVRWWEVRLRAAALRPLLSMLINGRWCGGSLRSLAAFYQLGAPPADRPDLILSAGGNTLYANAWLARRFSCRNLFIGHIRRLSPDCFWRVLSYRVATPSPPFLHWTFTPVPFLPEELDVAGRRLREDRGMGSAPLWTLLVGGNGGGYRYTADDWDGVAQFMTTAARASGIRWLLITGRRTGRQAESRLAARLPADVVAERSLYSEEGGARYLDFLGAADRIVATEDSHMMLTEAVSTGKPVLSIRPCAAKTHWTNQLFLDRYVAEQRLHRVPIAELATGRLDWPVAARSEFAPHVQLERLLAHALDERPREANRAA